MSLDLHAPWPQEGLESVPACPVCGSGARTLLHKELTDRVFFCAPGTWTLYRCAGCGTGYLDPRPNRATIGLAYSSYFTHGCVGEANERPVSAWRRHRVAQRSAYLNARYGYQIRPAGRVPRRLSPDRQQRWDRQVGFLKYPGKGARLLDLGCGNGRFLMQMRAVGWEVCGVEPDPKSAAQAVAAGLDVRVGDLESVSLPAGHFDAVTLVHVIEHLHDPLATLRACFRVLKPGGVISIATPNLQAQGHRAFGADWFALDAPRHLVLFTPDSMRRALSAAGFEPEPSPRVSLAAQHLFECSLLIQRGSDPMRRKPALPWPAKLKARWLAARADRAARVRPELAEELVLLACRPGAAATLSDTL